VYIAVGGCVGSGTVLFPSIGLWNTIGVDIHPPLTVLSSDMVRRLIVVVDAGAYGLFGRKFPCPFQYEYQPEDFG
jgi:hypothetical protein